MDWKIPFEKFVTKHFIEFLYFYGFIVIANFYFILFFKFPQLKSSFDVIIYFFGK
jgi:hypothetical protein